METVVGLIIVFVFGVCVYGLFDVLRQISKMD
jgi:hypothetical protein